VTKHTITNLLFAIALLSLVLLGTHYRIHFGWYVILLLLYFVVIALGSYFIQLQFFIASYCNGSSDKKQIAVTFDDGPQARRTSEILDILKTERVPATFFCIGRNIATQENILKRIDSEGHLIGTHSFHHHWSFPLQGKAKIAKEMTQSQKLVFDIIDKKPLLFRPPFGVTDPPLAAAITITGVSSVGWSIRSYDTVISSAEQLLKRVSKIKNGDIVLFHDAGLQTNVILPAFIEYVRSQGFEIVPLTQLLGINAYEDQ
jgi:peptidoglycan/xylan/chitin deacetylase (PgdA/CDA1 family)